MGGCTLIPVLLLASVASSLAQGLRKVHWSSVSLPAPGEGSRKGGRRPVLLAFSFGIKSKKQGACTVTKVNDVIMSFHKVSSG